MLHLNIDILNKVVATAKANASAQPRWVNAIARAALELQENPYIEVVDDHTLLIGSTSGESYTANGTCQCTAYAHNLPCYHRAMSRIYQRYTEAQTAAQQRQRAIDQMDELF